MKTLNRREILIGAGAVAAAARLPAVAEAATPAEVIPAWAVGTPGEFNWQHVIARTAEEAKSIFRAEWCVDSCEGEIDHSCGDCDGCAESIWDELVAERKSIWDGINDPTPADWLRAGYGTNCSRCGYETHPEEDGRPVGDEAVCEQCMTLEDWEIVDPERAAELRPVTNDEM